MRPEYRSQNRDVNTASDEQLVLEFLAGKSDRFELLVRRYGQELFHFLYRLLGSAAAAEDIVQETFLQLHVSMDRFDVSRKFRPWIFTIAANKGRDLLRSEKRRPVIPLDATLSSGTGDDDESVTYADVMSFAPAHPTLGMELEERSIHIRYLVEQLPSHLKEVLILGYYHGFSYKDMAEILNVPLGTIKSRLHAAVTSFGILYMETEKATSTLLNDTAQSG